MARRLAISLLAILVLAGSAAAGSLDERKRAIDERIAGLRERIDEANRRESVLTSDISAVTSRIRTLRGEVASAESRLARLGAELTLYRARLAKLTELHRLQTRKLKLLRREYALAERQLHERLVAIYEADDPDVVEVVLSAATFADMLDQLDYLSDVGTQDRRIARQVSTAKERVYVARGRTVRTKARVARTTKAIAERYAAQRAERDRLLASRRALAAARYEKQRTLASVAASERETMHEVAGLEQSSAALAAQIRAAQEAAARAAAQRAAATRSTSSVTGGDGVSTAAAAPAASTSASGFMWPVSGPVVSGFGMRWGRMHEGIDIAAGTGTPIRAAASGSVISAGWMGGYGNLVVVDHGGGLATAYAHMSTIGAGAGQRVVQGQVIGYVGCTGHCFGPHLHFEVRVNGSAVDPLGYL